MPDQHVHQGNIDELQEDKEEPFGNLTIIDLALTGDHHAQDGSRAEIFQG
jgi:hypothetical protein